MNIVDIYLDIMVQNIEDLKPGMHIRIGGRLGVVVSVEECPAEEQERCSWKCHAAYRFIMVGFDDDTEESCCGYVINNRRGVWLHTREEQYQIKTVNSRYRNLNL